MRENQLGLLIKNYRNDDEECEEKEATEGEKKTNAQKHKRMTQAELSRKVKVSQSMIAAIEGGRRIPSQEILEEIIHALQVPAEERDLWLVTAGYPTSIALDLTNEATRELHHALWDPNLSPEVKDLLTKAIVTVIHSCREIAKEQSIDQHTYDPNLLELIKTQREDTESILQ